MKFSRKRNRYESSNCYYSLANQIGCSYNWFVFTMSYKGKLVFNAYPYSKTTCKHYRMVRNKMKSYNRSPDIIVCSQYSLNDPKWLPDAIDYHEKWIKDLTDQINKPRTHRAANIKRKMLILVHKANIKELKNLEKLKYEG